MKRFSPLPFFTITDRKPLWFEGDTLTLGLGGLSGAQDDSNSAFDASNRLKNTNFVPKELQTARMPFLSGAKLASM